MILYFFSRLRLIPKLTSKQASIKGKMWVPLGEYPSSRSQNITPYCPIQPLYNQYIGGICGYISRVLSQGYPTFPFESSKQGPKTLDQGIQQHEQMMIERGRQVNTSLPGNVNLAGGNGMGTDDCDDNGGHSDEEDINDNDNDIDSGIDSDDDYNHESHIDTDNDQEKDLFSIASSTAAMRSLKSKGIDDPSSGEDGHLSMSSSTHHAKRPPPPPPPPDDVPPPLEQAMVLVPEQPPEEPEVAVAGERRVRQRLGSTSQKVFSSPAILNCISPLPHCVITLNANDHRWSSKWKRDIHCDSWVGELRNQSKSKSFVNTNESSWKTALQEVHKTVWNKFRLKGNLEISIPPQEPGIIPDEVFNELSAVVASLPTAKVYHT